MTNQERTRFRGRVKWKRFREKQMSEQNYCCEMCGTRYYGRRKRILNVHHLDPANYDDLQEYKFKVLCTTCHDIVENFVMKLSGKNRVNIKNLEKWMNLLMEYLPFFAQEIAKKLMEKKNG